MATVTVGLVATMLPAQATISDPTPGEVVQGVVVISDGGATGGSSTSCGITTNPGQMYSRVEVHRVNSAGTSVEQVFTQTRTVAAAIPAVPDNPATPEVDESVPAVPAVAKGPWTANWDSTGEPNGTYRILSFNRNASGTSGCTMLAESLTSDLLVTLENGVAVEATVPAEVVSGEDLLVDVVTKDRGTGAILPNRDVTVTVEGVAPVSVTTDAAGEATATVSLPDLDVGTYEVDAHVAGTPGYLVDGDDDDGEVDVLHRTVQVEWTGDTQTRSTETAHLEARVTDATPDSDRFGSPVEGLAVDTAIGNVTFPGTTDADGRTAHTIDLGAPARQIPASATFAGSSVYAPDSDHITYVVTDAAPTPDDRHGTVGGLTRLLGGLLRGPSSIGGTAVDVVDNLAPGVNAGTVVNNLLGIDRTNFQPVDDILAGTVGPVLDTAAQLGDSVDVVVDTALDVAEVVPAVGDLVKTLRIQYLATFQRPDGTSRTSEVSALMLVPTPIDVDGDTIPDVTANLTLNVDPAAPALIAGLPLVPMIDVIKLPQAPEVLPISIQAIIPADGLVSLGTGRIRIGYDARTTSAPDRATVSIGMSEGGFDLTVDTENAQDLALVGAIEGGLDLGIGGPVDPSDVEAGETRFSVNMSPAPVHTRITMGLGGSSAGIGVNFNTSAPSDVSLSFAQDLGEDHITAINASFETVDGNMSLVLNTGSASSGPVPELGLQLLSDNPMGRIAMKMQTIDQGRVTDDMNLNLVDVPTEVQFGVGDDGNIGISSSGEIGLLEAGFASGGEIQTLDEPAHLYMLSEPGLESASIRLPHVTSLSATLTGDIGLEINMAPTKLRAVMNTPESALDAAIYDAPQIFSLGLAADGAFVISGSAPIDLITLTLHDSTGSLAGASDITVRIEDIPSLLAVSLLDGNIEFATGGDAVGLLELVVGDAPPFVPGEDALFANFDPANTSLAVRVHGLRTITAGLDPSAPSFLLDTVANAIMNLNIAAPNPDPLLPPLAVEGRIDRLQPNMQFGVASTESGALAGLTYKADEPSNSITFDIPGLAAFTVFDPLPREFTLLQPPAPEPLTITGSEAFTLQLNASFDGVDAEINNMRIRHMQFASAEAWPGQASGAPAPTGQEGYQAFFLNTTRFGADCPDGCVYTMGDTTRTLANFNDPSATPATAAGTLVLGPVDVGGLDATVTMTPRGFAATNAKVTMNVVQSGLSATATHVSTDGVLHCSGTNNSNGTNMTTGVFVIIITITVQMRGALCDTGSGAGGNPTPTPRADLVTAGAAGPADVVVGTNAVHTFTVKNDGPNPASGTVATGTYSGDLGDPSVACTNSGVGAASAGTATCTWAAAMDRNATRTMTLTWPTATATAGNAETTAFTATATTPGNDASGGPVTTTVRDSVANLDITGTTGAAKAVGGTGDLVHTATVKNNGPDAATNVTLAAVSSAALAAPTVTCSGDGTASADGCTWAAVPSGEDRTITLTYGVPVGVPNGTLSVDYTASSDTPGTGDTASASTEIGTVVANIGLAVDASERVLPGEEVTHTATLTNGGPSDADSARILADYDEVLGAPTVGCSAGGTSTHFPELQRVRCLWLGDTAPGVERVMTLSWTAAADTALGTVGSVDYRATSNTPGTETALTGSTLIDEAPVVPDPATLEMTGTVAPALWAPGSNLVQTATARSGGGTPVANLRIVADLPADSPAVPLPTVTCGSGGAASTINDPLVADDTQAVCTYAGNTNPNTNRVMTLTTSSANLTTARTNAGGDALITADVVATGDNVATTAPLSLATTVKSVVGNVSMASASGGSGASTANNATLVHGGTAARTAPNPTGANATVVITAQVDPVLAAVPSPVVSCPSAVVTTGTAVPGGFSCTWAASILTTSRTMTLTWPIGTAPGTYTTVFSSSSDQPGAWATVSRSTVLTDAATINLPITNSTAPATALTNGTVAHSATAARQSPVGNTATHLITATIDPEATAAPTISCPSAVPTIGAAGPGAGQFTCTWATGTAQTNRVMTVTYPAGSLPVGAAETVFSTSSSLPGTYGGPITKTTDVQQATNVMTVNGVTAKASTAPGTTLVHHIDVRNTGNVAATDFRIVAEHNGALGHPTVTCAGTATTPPGVATQLDATHDECRWTGTTAAGSVIRRMTLTWTVAPGQADVVETVNYTATATPTTGVAVTDGTATTSTAVVTPVAPASLAAPPQPEPFWASAVTTSGSDAPPAVVAPAPAKAKSCVKLLLGVKVCI